MNKIAKCMLGIIPILGIMQLFQPTRNSSGEVLSTDISNTVSVPMDVLSILKRSCYDCHSNNTNYPWYSWIQPGAWFMNNHIEEGKIELNFSEFGIYSKRKREGRFKAISNIISNDEMPLKSYTIIHTNAKLTITEKALLENWANNLANND